MVVVELSFVEDKMSEVFDDDLVDVFRELLTFSLPLSFFWGGGVIWSLSKTSSGCL